MRFWTMLRDLIGGPRVEAGSPAGRLAEGARVYAIGDIHGEIGLLRQLLDLIAADAQSLADSPVPPDLVFLGDYVDRGADSRGVIELLSRQPPPGFRCHFLVGNHEAAMLEFLANPAPGGIWLEFGGLETLASYGVRASSGSRAPGRLRELRDRFAEALPPHHLAFVKALKPMVVIDGYAFVHAGIRPGRAIESQKVEDLLWIREPFLGSTRHHGKVIVHGHTIVDQPELLPNRVGLDTGAYASGRLSAAVFWGDQRRILQAGGS